MANQLKKKGRQTVSTGYSMTPELRDRLKARAEALDTHASTLLTHILEQYFKANPRPNKLKGV